MKKSNATFKMLHEINSVILKLFQSVITNFFPLNFSYNNLLSFLVFKKNKETVLTCDLRDLNSFKS